MTTTTTTSALVPGYVDVTRLAVASFLARHREPTPTTYPQDLKAYLGWCQAYVLFDADLDDVSDRMNGAAPKLLANGK
jgi:hypothetical protein